MANYPGTIDVFTNPVGTNTLDSPDHALQHSDANDAIEAIQAVVGTTAGTSVLSPFSAGEFPARVNVGGTLVQTLTGGTINSSTLGTPTAIGGSYSNSTLGTPAITGGTINSSTLGTPTLNTPTIQNYDGWQDANETWTYASATTFTVASDVTDKYQKGDKIKFTQATDGVKYMYIIGVSESGGTTTITVTGGSDYDLDNEAITANYYSKMENPQGFPDWFNWTPSFTGFSSDPGGEYEFCIKGSTCFINVSGTNGTSNSSVFYISKPVAQLSGSPVRWGTIGLTTDNGVNLTTPGIYRIQQNLTSFYLYKDCSLSGFTTSGNKSASFIASYQI